MGRHLKSGITARATGAAVRIGFHRRNSREGNWRFQTETIAPQEHYSSKLEQYLRFADHLDIDPTPVQFGLAPTVADRERASALLDGVRRPFVAFVLGSSCPSRRWFPDRTAATARAVWERYGYEAVLLGTAADTSFAEAVVAGLDVPTRTLAGRTTLRELVAVLSEAELAITPDSGAMHIAAAVGIPVVSLWGATSAARSAPYGSAGVTLTGAAACVPCYLTQCPIGRICMQTIGPEDVLARVSAIVDGARRLAR
jgi:ADP-heptose:LPS heptosyltransferase